LLNVDLYEDLIDKECGTIAPVFSFQSSCVDSAKLDTPERDDFTADDKASFSEQIFNISATEIKAIVEPRSVRNDIWRKLIALVSIHAPTLSSSAI
jgi:hypothetical protein